MNAPLPRKSGFRWNPLVVVLSLSMVFFLLFVALSGALYLRSSPNKVSQSPMTGGLFGGGSVGVVEVSGVIMDSKKVLKALDDFEERADVKAVVLRINSPGGAVGPSQEIYEAVKAFPKPIVASMGSIAASGGFYVAMGAQKVFANAGTLTGSIGVIMQFANLSKLYEWAKVQRFALTTGKHKDSGADYKEMDPESRALLQEMIDDVLKQFAQAVVEGRKLTPEKVRAVADGRIFSGSQAKSLQLVDELGGIQEAIEEAGKLAKLKGKPNVVYPDKRRGSRMLDLLLDERRDEDEAGSSAGGGLGAALSRLLGGAGTVLPGVETQSLSPGIYWLWTGGS